VLPPIRHFFVAFPDFANLGASMTQEEAGVRALNGICDKVEIAFAAMYAGLSGASTAYRGSFGFGLAGTVTASSCWAAVFRGRPAFNRAPPRLIASHLLQ